MNDLPFGSDIASTLAHPTIDRLARTLASRSARVLQPAEAARRAAVALIVKSGQESDIDLLLIKRAIYDGDPWSGHVALPGGRHEPLDLTLEQTALRETLEETGIDLNLHGRVLGPLDELQPRPPVLPPLIIRPYVAILAGNYDLTLSNELTEAFWVPVAQLKQPDAMCEIEIERLNTTVTVQAYRIGPHAVWGLTERILNQFLELV